MLCNQAALRCRFKLDMSRAMRFYVLLNPVPVDSNIGINLPPRSAEFSTTDGRSHPMD